MSIISILNPKGGSGKTTLTTNMARSLHERGFKVLIVDSDPQGSARDWHAAYDENPLPLVALDRPQNIKSLGSVAANYDFVLIDGAAKLEDMVAAAVKVSDCVLIPVQPSPYDIWAASELVDGIKTRQDLTDGKPVAAFVVTRRIEGTKLGDEVRTALDEYDLPVLKTAVTQRQTYPQTASEGRTVFDGTNTKAQEEIEAIIGELLSLISFTQADEVKNGTLG